MNTTAMKKAAKFCGFPTTLAYRQWLRALKGKPTKPSVSANAETRLYNEKDAK